MSITHYNTVPLPAEALGFQEAEDSPSESWSGGQLSATRTLYGPSRNRFAFLRSIMGYTYAGVPVSGITPYYVVPPISYPDNPGLVLSSWSTSLRGRPVDMQTGNVVSDLYRPIVSECHGLECQITLNYTEPELDGGPSASGAPSDKAAGTLLTIDESWGMEEVQIEIPHMEVQPDKQLPFVDPEEKPEEKPETSQTYVSVHNINVNWSGALAPNWDKIYSYLGRLNSSVFWGYPPGAVRFEGLQKTSRLNIANQWVYDIRFTFTAKTAPIVNQPTYDGPSKDRTLTLAQRNNIIKNDRIGVWNRVWMPIPLKLTYDDPSPIIDPEVWITHWYWLVDKGESELMPLLGDSQSFWDLMKYPSSFVLTS